MGNMFSISRLFKPTMKLMRSSPLPIVMLTVIFVGVIVGSSGVARAQTPSLSGNIFYFHYQSEIYHSVNNSAIVLEEANLTAPVSSTPKIVEVAAAIRNATTPFGTIWVGSAAWVTRPLAENETLQGSVAFNVWLSSDDVSPSFSGVGAGVAVLDANNQTVGNYVYSFSYAQGKILSPTPTEYGFNVALNLQVSAGERLVFAVGVGSTTEGWRMKIYLDDPEHPSRAQLPSNITVIPEFPPATAIVPILTSMILSLVLAGRTRHRHRCVPILGFYRLGVWMNPR